MKMRRCVIFVDRMASILDGVLCWKRPKCIGNGPLLGPLLLGTQARGSLVMTACVESISTQIGWPLFWAAFYIGRGLPYVGRGLYWALYYAVRARMHPRFHFG